MTKPKKPAQTLAKTVAKAPMPKPATALAKPVAPVIPQTSDNPPPNPAGKIGVLTSLLRQPDGATIVQMCEITGWQKHSVRGALAGAVRKAGFDVTSTREEGQPRVYRIIAPAKPEKGRKAG